MGGKDGNSRRVKEKVKKRKEGKKDENSIRRVEEKVKTKGKRDENSIRVDLKKRNMERETGRQIKRDREKT